MSKQMEHEDNGIELGVLQFLPIEMWETILERVDDSKDIRNFCRAWEYPDWDALLHSTKGSWLFDEIFPVVFPYLLTKEQVLTCRLVCTRWRKAVDHFLESNPCRRPPTLHSHSNDTRLGTLPKLLRDKGLLHNALTTEKIPKFLSRFPNVSKRNPVVGRSVHFDWSQGDPSVLLPFLSKVGHHVWDFRVEIREDTPLKFLLFLQQFLALLPNLKCLEIFGETTLVIEETVTANLKELQNHKLSLPQLPHLETLDVTVFGQYRDKIMEILLSTYSSNLRRLSLYCYQFPGNSWIYLENVSELTLHLDSDKQLESLHGLNLPLVRRFTVYILRNSNRGSYPNFSQLFDTINACFSSTLRALSIEFPVTYSPIQWSTQSALPMLRLPHLKTLELREATFHSFNFITSLSSLEYLHLYKYRWGHRVGMAHHYGGNIQEEAGVKEILDLKPILDNPVTSAESIYASNLWLVLPRMKVFTLSKASNTRGAANTEQCFRKRN